MSVNPYRAANTGLGRGGRLGSRFAPKEEEEDQGGGGLLGLGIGPDIGLGGVTALKEIGMGLTGLVGQGVSLLTPGKDGPGATEFGSALGKGIASSVAGTVDTFTDPLDLGYGIGDFTGKLWGEEYEGKDFFQKAGERGILPALIEDVGNVSLVAGAMTAPVKGAAISARLSGNTAKANRLTAVHGNLLKKPLIQAAQHPYRVGAGKVRDAYLKPALLKEAGPAVRNSKVAASLGRFASERGFQRTDIDTLARANPETGAELAAAYKEMPTTPKTPEELAAAQESYGAMASELDEQFDHLVDDLGLDVQYVDENPYTDSAEMFKDVEENGVLKVFKTKDGEHPFLSPEQNDRFRALHDLAGHAEFGNDFSRHGEEVAAASHLQMFSEAARPAVVMETRAQNSFLNFDPDNVARKAAGEAAEFSEQKFGLLPDELAFKGVSDRYFTAANKGGSPLTGAEQLAARIERRLVTRETMRFGREQKRIAETARHQANRSTAVRVGVRTARNHLIDAAKQAGVKMSRAEASRIVGSQVDMLTDGSSLIEATIKEVNARHDDINLPDEVVRQKVLGGYEPIPDNLDTPELRAALEDVASARLEQIAEARETLLSSRKGTLGLEGLGSPTADTPALTAKQQRARKRAKKRVERAYNLDRPGGAIDAERARAAKEIAAQHDRVAKITNSIRELAEQGIRAAEKFDISRKWTPVAWRKPGAIAATAEEMFRRTVNPEGGGATFMPHQGRFLELEKDSGYIVAAADKTIREIPLDDFTPQHITDVIDEYQDAFVNTSLGVGTWLSDGTVHIDVVQKFRDADEAFVHAAARQQLAITDLARGEFPSISLRTRPDIAAEFLKPKNMRALKSMSKGIRDALGAEDGLATSRMDARAMQDLLMRQAVAARDLGKVSSPDEFLKKFTVKAGKKPSTKENALRQIVLDWDLSDIDQQEHLLKDMFAQLGDGWEKASRWYHRSHEAVNSLIPEDATVTLLNGKPHNARDLVFQLLGATSFNIDPKGNFGLALHQLTELMESTELDKRRTKITKLVKEHGQGKLTLDDLLEEIAPGAPAAVFDGKIKKDGTRAKSGKMSPRLLATDTLGTGIPHSRQAVTAILNGFTFDQWTPEWIGQQYKEGWGYDWAPTDGWKEKAWETIQDEHPEFFERATKMVGDTDPDAVRNQAIREFYGSDYYTKIMSFYDNLAHPERSVAVTLDMWMSRLFGGSAFTTQGSWVRTAEALRDMSERLTTRLDKPIPPNSLQAMLWVYVNKEISDIRVGHFMNAAQEAQDLIDAGQRLDAADNPIQRWVEEAVEPYEAKKGKGETGPIKREHRLLRPGSSEVTTETVNYIGEERAANIRALRGGVDPQKKKAGYQPGHIDRWNRAVEEINAHIDANDIDKAQDALDAYRESTRASLAGALDGKKNALDLEDHRLNPETPAFTRQLDRAQGAIARRFPDKDALLQSFEDQVLGEFVPASDTTKAAIRVFESGNLATLVHENGHLLRQMLTDGQMAAAEKAYGLKKGKWTVAAEERWANDFMKYLARGEAPAGLGEVMGRVKEALSEIWEMVRGTFQHGRVNREIGDLFDEWLEPAERALDGTDGGVAPLANRVGDVAGTPRQQLARPPKSFPEDASKGDFYHAGRKGASAVAEQERLVKRTQVLERAKQEATEAIAELEKQLSSGTLPSQVKQSRYLEEARRIEGKITKELGDAPAMANVPAIWQPMYHAAREIAKMVPEYPDLAPLLKELPQTFAEVQAIAKQKGFQPAHVREFTPAQVKSMVFNNLRLGIRSDISEQRAGTRNIRTGVLRQKSAVEHSIEAWTAAMTEAAIEKRTNAVIGHIDQAVARFLPDGQPMPDDWVEWSPTRAFLLTGTEVSSETGKVVKTAAGDTQIVPKSVVKMLRREVSDPQHPFYTAINKMTSPWRTLVLTLSPGWYARNIAGNAILALAEGVSPADWVKAWHSYKDKDELGHFRDIPQVADDTLAQEAGSFADSSLIPLAPGREGARELISEYTKPGGSKTLGKARGSAAFTQRKLLRLNQVVDQFARAAVYHKGRRLNLTPEAAWQRASNALVDYGNLSPFERTAVRAVIPFYSWQKGILKVTLNQAIDHPGRASTLMALGQMQQDYVADMLGVGAEDVPDYYKHLVGDRNFRGYNPFADPTEILSPEGIIRSMNPFLEVFMRKGLGAPEFFPEQRRLGMFGTVEDDVDAPAELGRLLTSSPAGRAAQGGAGDVLSMGLKRQDISRLSERLQKSRDQLAAG